MRISDWSSDVCSSDLWTLFPVSSRIGVRTAAGESMMGKAWRALAGQLAGKAKLALIVPLSIAMAATATADTVPQVTLATPGSSGTRDGTIPSFTLRLSEDKGPLGDPHAPEPAPNDRKKTGRAPG